ncbi:MAG: PP2C family protein-serine/threonine phosphatase [bacterium]
MNLNNTSALRNLSALVDFSNLINSSLDVNFTLNNLLLTCFGKLHTTKGLIALRNENGSFEIKLCKGFSKEIVESFPVIDSVYCEENEKIKDYLKKFDIKMFKCLNSSSTTLGFVLFGAKLTKKPYEEEDYDFLNTLLNIAASSIENSMVVEKLRISNRTLDSKVNQLSSLFDLSKEFSGILETSRVGKLLVFSIIGQLMVSKYAVVYFEGNQLNIIESKFCTDFIAKNISSECYNKLTKPTVREELEPDLIENGVQLIIPMNIKGETKGLIILGKRYNNASYSQSDIEYISSIASLAIISIENGKLFLEALEKQKYEKDLEIARNIQHNLLPQKVPKTNHFDIATYTQSARQVGGDYYDLVKLDKNKTLFAIADVSGKGVQAALLMANMQAFLKSICKQNIPLDQASNLINDLVSENTTNGSFITFFWGTLNDETMEFEYVNAGHNPPLLIREGKIIKLKKGGMILGVMETIIPYVSETIQLVKDDLIVLFTDGISEAMDIEHNEYSDERLEEIVLANTDKNSGELINIINDDVKVFTKNAEQSDDITLLIVKIK